jgi:putative transposase
MKTFKFRIYPTSKQKKSLQKYLDGCRWVYNKTLETRKKSWEDEKKSLSLYDTQKFIPEWKEIKPELENIQVHVLRDAQSRLDKAFKAFFRRIEKRTESNNKPGYPRFQGYDRYDSFTFPDGGFKIKDKFLKMSRIGAIRIKQHRPIEGKIKALTIRRDSTGKWFACFVCEVENNFLTKLDKFIGVDVGLINFATFSDDEKIPNPRFFKESEKKLAKYQSKFNKTKKGSFKRKKLKRIVSKIYSKVVNKRTDFAHKLSRRIVNENQIIVFEKLNIEQMQQGTFKSIRKSISNVAWNQFVNMTTYKAEYAGRQTIFINPRNTSKMCSRCGQIVDKDLSVRTHSCPHCGLVLDRDHNAAINILRLGMQSLDNIQKAVCN